MADADRMTWLADSQIKPWWDGEIGWMGATAKQVDSIVFSSVKLARMGRGRGRVASSVVMGCRG